MVAAQEAAQYILTAAWSRRTAAHAAAVLLRLGTATWEEMRFPALPGGLKGKGGEDSLLDCPGAVPGDGSIKCGVAEAVSAKCFNQLDTSAVL